MRVAVVGRGRPLLTSVAALIDAGHQIPLIFTTTAEDYYGTPSSEYKSLAQSIKAEFRESRAVNSAESLDLFLRSKCDVAISMNWPG